MCMELSFLKKTEIDENLEKNREKINKKESNVPLAKVLKNLEKYDYIKKNSEQYDSNSKYKIDENICETDDEGNIYKRNGELLPNIRYVMNEIEYTTDNDGRIVTWKGEPNYKPENERDEIAQKESGGKERQKDDDGGHIVARVLGGTSGKENIVPMRDTINRGDYKKSENKIIEAKKQGKDVQDSGIIIYKEDSIRPSEIERTYVIDSEKNILKVDNTKGSKDLLKDIEIDISSEDIRSLSDEIEDMEKDEKEVSITSILKKYDKDNNLISITVGMRDENIGEKKYQTYKI